ncbi:MAG TPA: Maf family protein [Solirubrobacteraceae bacterium]|jgi:septum formation protein|nr:Maf family protein [Solirubrobacteraceae bacterium]
MAPAGGGEGGVDSRDSRAVGAGRGASLVLASGSPQRRELLARLGVPFTVRVSGASELERGEDAAAVAVENALRKARAARRPGTAETVLGCDTIVVLDGVIYGKPPDATAARETLAALGGRTHEVISGVALLLALAGGETAERTAVARTRVTFRALDAKLLDWYVGTEEWRGRSGGYAIQGAGASLALAIDGEVENVVGLPLKALARLGPELFGS